MLNVRNVNATVIWSFLVLVVSENYELLRDPRTYTTFYSNSDITIFTTLQRN